MPKLPVLTSIWPDWALRLVTAMAASTTFCSWDWTVAASRPSRVADKVAVSRSCTTSTEPSADNCTTLAGCACAEAAFCARSEEHTSELQSQSNLVCRLLLEKKKKKTSNIVLLQIYK